MEDKMENDVLALITMDRLNLPIKSLENKLAKRRLAQAKDIAEDIGDTRFVGERTYAFVEEEDKSLARGTKEAIAEFTEEHPEYGAILKGKIAEKRVQREKHLYFGVNPGARLSGEAYLGVMRDLGISEHRAHLLYPVLNEIGRDLQGKKKEAGNRIIVGKYDLE